VYFYPSKAKYILIERLKNWNWKEDKLLLVYLIPLALFVFNLFLKVQKIKYEGIGLDEPFSIYVSQFDLSAIVSYLNEGNNPPLYEVFLHFWTNIFGIEAKAVRIPSTIFSCLTAVMIYKIGRQFFSLRTGLIAAILFTFSNHQMFFAHEARVYPMFMFLTCMSMFFFLKIINSEKNKRTIIGFIVSSILLVYAHYFGVIVLGIQLLSILFIDEIRSKQLKSFLKLYGIISLLYLPQLVVLGKRFFISASEGTWLQPVESLGPLHAFLDSQVNNSAINYVLLLLFLFLVLNQWIKQEVSSKIIQYSVQILSVFGLMYSTMIVTPWQLSYNFLLRYWEFSSYKFFMGGYFVLIVSLFIFVYRNKKVSDVFKIHLLWFVLPFLGMFFVSIWIPMYLDRYMIFITPVFYLLIAVGLSNEKWPTLKLFTPLFLIVMCFSMNLNVKTNQDVRRMAVRTKEIQKGNSIVLLNPPHLDMNYAYHFAPEAFISEGGLDELKGLRERMQKHNVYTQEELSVKDSSILLTQDELIWVDGGSALVQESNALFDFVKERYTLVEEHGFGVGFSVRKFIKKVED
jgi:uncharacterized membrane protein